MNGRRRLALVSVVALAVLAVTGPVASAQGRCSVATLKGSYGLVEQGTVVTDIGMPVLPPVPYPTANVAIVTYDGAGKLSATYRAVFGGVPLPPGSLTGTYTVGPDCTYTDDVPAVMMKRAGVIVGEGTNQEVRTVSTVPWIVATGTRTKMTVGNCSVGDLKGDYLLVSQGVVGPPDARQPVAGVGVLTYNGRGNFYGNETREPRWNTITEPLHRHLRSQRKLRRVRRSRGPDRNGAPHRHARWAGREPGGAIPHHGPGNGARRDHQAKVTRHGPPSRWPVSYTPETHSPITPHV